MSKFNFESAITAIRAIIETSTISSVKTYWLKQLETAEAKHDEKRITDGHQVSNPLAYFLVPMLGSRGRKVPAHLVGQCDPNNYALAQFSFAVKEGWTKKADENLRSLTAEAVKAIDAGLFQSLARGDSAFGDAELRRAAYTLSGIQNTTDKKVRAESLNTAQEAISSNAENANFRKHIALANVRALEQRLRDLNDTENADKKVVKPMPIATQSDSEKLLQRPARLGIVK